MVELELQVNAALLALYENSNSEIKHQADVFLKDFQKSKEAWEVEFFLNLFK